MQKVVETSTRPRPDVLTEDLVHMYTQQELSTTEIAREVGVSQHMVYRRLKIAGVQMRPRGGPNCRSLGETHPRYRQDIDPAEVARLYIVEEQGVRDIAATLGVAPGTVERRLSEAGVERRPSGPRPKSTQ